MGPRLWSYHISEIFQKHLNEPVQLQLRGDWHPNTKREALWQEKKQKEWRQRFLWDGVSLSKEHVLKIRLSKWAKTWWNDGISFFCDFEEGFFCSTDLVFPSVSSSFCLPYKTKDRKLLNHMPSRLDCLSIWTNVHLVCSCQNVNEMLHFWWMWKKKTGNFNYWNV